MQVNLQIVSLFSILMAKGNRKLANFLIYKGEYLRKGELFMWGKLISEFFPDITPLFRAFINFKASTAF